MLVIYLESHAFVTFRCPVCIAWLEWCNITDDRSTISPSFASSSIVLSVLTPQGNVLLSRLHDVSHTPLTPQPFWRNHKCQGGNVLFVINGDSGFPLITFLMIRTKPYSPIAVTCKTVLEMHPWQCYSVHSVLLFVINNLTDKSKADFFPFALWISLACHGILLCLRETWITWDHDQPLRV